MKNNTIGEILRNARKATSPAIDLATIKDYINEKMHHDQNGRLVRNHTLKCDLCGQPTNTNHFTDEFTVLCEHCATNSGVKGGRTAAEYIAQKATGGAK